MVHSLSVFYAPQGDFTDTRSDTLGVLTHADSPDLADWLMQKWQSLTPEQGRAVCLYLRYVASHSTDRFLVRRAEKGLGQHWGRFCGEALPGREARSTPSE